MTPSRNANQSCNAVRNGSVWLGPLQRPETRRLLKPSTMVSCVAHPVLYLRADHMRVPCQGDSTLQLTCESCKVPFNLFRNTAFCDELCKATGTCITSQYCCCRSRHRRPSRSRGSWPRRPSRTDLSHSGSGSGQATKSGDFNHQDSMT